MPTLAIQAPYLLFLGSEKSPTYAKTAAGLAHWRPELCMGQLRLTPDTLDLGLPDYDVTEAVANGAQTLVIGTAVVGGGEGCLPLSRRQVRAALRQQAEGVSQMPNGRAGVRHRVVVELTKHRSVIAVHAGVDGRPLVCPDCVVMQARLHDGKRHNLFGMPEMDFENSNGHRPPGDWRNDD